MLLVLVWLLLALAGPAWADDGDDPDAVGRRGLPERLRRIDEEHAREAEQLDVDRDEADPEAAIIDGEGPEPGDPWREEAEAAGRDDADAEGRGVAGERSDDDEPAEREKTAAELLRELDGEADDAEPRGKAPARGGFLPPSYGPRGGYPAPPHGSDGGVPAPAPPPVDDDEPRR